MQPDTMLGIGLAVLGLGLPTTVALLRLLPSRNGSTSVPGMSDFCKTHGRRLDIHEEKIATASIERAVLQEHTANIKATLLRMENKIDGIAEQKRPN